MTREDAATAIAAQHDATPELQTHVGRYLAVFEVDGARVLRDYSDEWCRDANAPADAIVMDLA